jgi:DivIVA domain-containing protein
VVAVELDRQSIERRDFPIGRRGYDPASVDAHLRALAEQVQELRGALAGRGADSLAASASAQVQAIVAAAESAAADIESDAQRSAERTRAQAQSDAEQTRADAIAQAQAHVAAVGQATATLLSHVESLDGETHALVENLRAGATRLAGDLAAVETNMGELYDAAAGRASNADAAREPFEVTVSAVSEQAPEPHVPPRPADVPAPPVAGSVSTATATKLAPSAAPAPASSVASASAERTGSAGNASNGGDAEGARLVALNMALNGDSREETDRYLAENYEIEDRDRLLDEVYAAIGG